MLRVGKSDNYKCPSQAEEKIQELFANKIGKGNHRINEKFQTFGPVGFEKEMSSLILSVNKKKTSHLVNSLKLYLFAV